MTGPVSPVRQPANTRASVLPSCFLRLAAFPGTPETRAFTGGGDRERRTPRARPMRTIPRVTLQGLFPPAEPRSGGRIVRAVGSAYTAGPENWARPRKACGIPPPNAGRTRSRAAPRPGVIDLVHGRAPRRPGGRVAA